MNQETIDKIVAFLGQWGFWQVAVIAAIVLLTLVVKIPLYRAGEKYQAKTGINKSRVTWVISLIPFIFAFIGALCLYLWPIGWNVNSLVSDDWAIIVKNAGVLGTAAIGVYEFFKKIAKAATAKATAKEVEEAKNIVEIKDEEKESRPNEIKIH